MHSWCSAVCSPPRPSLKTIWYTRQQQLTTLQRSTFHNAALLRICSNCIIETASCRVHWRRYARTYRQPIGKSNIRDTLGPPHLPGLTQQVQTKMNSSDCLRRIQRRKMTPPTAESRITHPSDPGSAPWCAQPCSAVRRVQLSSQTRSCPPSYADCQRALHTKPTSRAWRRRRRLRRPAPLCLHRVQCRDRFEAVAISGMPIEGSGSVGQ